MVHIRLQYISMQHTGAENAFLLRIFDRCAAKTWIFFKRHEVSRRGGGPRWSSCPPQDLAQMAPLRRALAKVLSLYGIPEKYIKVIWAMYENNTAAVKVGNVVSNWFCIKSGFK